MARDLTPLAKKLGMRYYEEENLLFGIVSGYECALREQPSKKMMMLHVTAKSPRAEDEGMLAHLQSLKAEHEDVTAAVYENFTASLRIRTYGDADLFELIEQLLGSIIAYAKKENYIPCCAGCGKTRDVHRYLLDGDARAMCPACRAKAEAEKTNSWVKKKFPQHNKIKGWLLVAVILLIAMTVWVGVYVSGLSATLVGVAMTVTCFYVYEHFAGRMKGGSITVMLLLLLLTVFLCHNICVCLELAAVIGQTQQITFLGVMLFIPEFLKDPTNLEVYLIQLGLAVLAVALAAAPMLWLVWRSWHHKERLESLEEPAA